MNVDWIEIEPMISNDKTIDADVVIVGAGLSGAACAKRLVDAGYSTIIMYKKELPRHKICSGILSPRGHRFLIENFGPLPRKILFEPTSCRGVTFHFPGMLSLPMDFHHGPTPHLHRRYSDFWAVEKSNAEIHDRTRFTGLKDRGRYVDLFAEKDEEPVRYRTKFVIGADGPVSPVTRSIYPDYPKMIPWFIVGQKLHGIIECPLSRDYFHFWFHPDLGHYTWSHERENRQIVGVGFLRGDNFDRRHQRVTKYLEEKHNVKLEPAHESEACLENFGPSLLNTYVFGKGNVIITGQAAGFLNMMAEGMSCALHSGAIAGEAVIESLNYNLPIQHTYRTMIQSEVGRCTDQWNPFKIIFSNPHEADFRKALKKHGAKDRIMIVKEIYKFIRLYAPLKWGRKILRQTAFKEIKGRYLTSGWL